MISFAVQPEKNIIEHMFYQNSLLHSKTFDYLKMDKSPTGTANLILLHGYGANAGDLYSLHPLIENHNLDSIYFLEGPVDVAGVPNGKAWFPLDQQALQMAMMTGQPKDYSQMLPDGLPQAIEKLLSFIEELNIGENLILGGFSQGAMVALQLALKLKVPAKGLILFSTTPVNQKESMEMAKQYSDMPFLQSHGKADPVLGYELAENLYNELKSSAGWRGDFFSFEGQHEIPMKIIQESNQFLQKIL